MTGPAKREMAIVLPAKIESIGIGKSFRVTIAGAHHRDDCLAFANLFSSEFSVLRRNARRVLAWTFVTQQLLNRGRDQSQIVLQSLKLIGIA